MNENVTTYVLVAIGSALGGMARQWCGVAAVRLWGASFPWGTIGINIFGSLVIGAAAALTEPQGRLPLNAFIRQFVIVGLCGGYTTFSSFSLQTMVLLRDGRWIEAVANVVFSVVLCLIAVGLGYFLTAQLG